MTRSPAAEEGSAVVEFVLVAALLVLVALGVLQLVLAAHVRSTLTACAAEGARIAAVARQGDDAGAARASECVEDSLGLDVRVRVDAVSVAGREAVRVTLAAPAPALTPWQGDVEASGRALREGDDGP